MIHLITGIPGSGKSLLAVELLYKNSVSDKIRPAYSNINGLDTESLRCFELEDVEHWFDLPDGSLIVIDECQRWFRPRPNGSAVPEYISRFETHRHQGLDIILITQHPGLIDRNIRKLVELHQHMNRAFGMKRRTVLEWNTCNENPEPSHSSSDAAKKQKPFDKKLFKFYKSATVHTHKLRLPWKYIGGAVGSALILSYCIYSVWHSMNDKIDSNKSKQSNTPAQAEVVTDPLPGKQPSVTNDGELQYRGFQRSGGQLTVFLEDPTSGQYFTLQDFDGYRRQGVDIVFYIADFNYRVRDRDLLALLP